MKYGYLAFPRWGSFAVHTADRYIINQMRGSANVASLGFRFDLVTRENEYGFLAYPKAYGQARITPVDAYGRPSGIGTGGWDGAKDDPTNPKKFGPAVVVMPIINEEDDDDFVEMYVYRTDWFGGGMTRWIAQ